MAAVTPCPGAGASQFHLRDGSLWCEDVAVADLAARFGTPLYVYSAEAMRARLREVRQAFGPDAAVCFAVKANSNLHILKLLYGEGCGFDLVSGGELERLRVVGLSPEQSVFAGVAKQRWELESAVAANLMFVNVESRHELSTLSAVGAAAGARVRVALRVNPGVDPGTHAFISTGQKGSKFGVSMRCAGELVAAICEDPWLELVGYHVHLGSQLRSVEPYRQALDRVLDFVDGDARRADGVRYYDLGGGFGISYGDGDALEVSAVGAALLPDLKRRGWTPVVEPGRYLIGDAGILLTSVLGEKAQDNDRFVLVDAAMNDLIRPALYQAEHPIVPVRHRLRAPEHVVDVVGPVCESGDFLGRKRSLPSLVAGDLLAVLAAGAYGSSMASTYNSRPRPAEVMVDGGVAKLVRRRETFQRMFEDELEAQS